MKGQIANSEMERVASLLVADLAGKGMLLDYSPESLTKVDLLLANDGHHQGNGQANRGLLELAGAYFGEVIRRALGSWFENVPPDNATALLVDQGFEFWIRCHAIADESGRLQGWRRQAGSTA